MPIVHRLSNSRVYVHARGEHPPPHFHLVGPGWNASIDIATLVIIKGDAPRADLIEAITWAHANRKLLLAKWSEFNERDD